MRPDFGVYLFNKSLGQAPRYFYDVIINNIDRLEENLLSTTLATKIDRMKIATPVYPSIIIFLCIDN
jgi:hypothetical protein